HPLALLRAGFAAEGVTTSDRLGHLGHGRRLKVAGLVLVRQRPGSAKGVVFITLEDEHGVANLIVTPPVFERCRKAILGARLLLPDGGLERLGELSPLLAARPEDRSSRPAELPAAPRHVHPAALDGGIARADEVKHPPDRDARIRRPDTAYAFPDGRN